MWNRTRRAAAALTALLFLLTASPEARDPVGRDGNRPPMAAQDTAGSYCTGMHTITEFSIAVNSNGTIGGVVDRNSDCYLGNRFLWPGGEFPRKSRLEHINFASLWFGAVIDSDTLVSTGASSGWWTELFADRSKDIIYRSNLDPFATGYNEQARAEEEYAVVYNDTLLSYTSYDWVDRRWHKPLKVEVTQTSYAWSYSYAEDFIIFELEIENIGVTTLNDFYVGLYCEADVGLLLKYHAGDDISGFLQEYPAEIGCGYNDTVNIAWTADNDGDPYEGEWLYETFWPGGTDENPYKSAPHVTGMRVLRKPSSSVDLSFNWWQPYSFYSYDFGPRRWENYRDFGTGGTGIPEGDRNKYNVMSNGEIDYDQIFTARIRPFDPVWLTPPTTVARSVSTGGFGNFLLSYGPMTLPPGSSVPFVFAFVAGENFHTDVNNLRNLPDNPDAYYKNLDFSDLVKNSNWAARIFDNPGVDTDGDGYFGKSRICVYDSVATESGWVATSADTVFYEGDGIPDWKAAGPPPAPIFWVEPTVNGLRVRFNGNRSETEKDLFTNIADFEGYHIWLGRDEREESYSLVASYDLENYDKYVWNQELYPEPEFELKDRPFSRQQLRCLYGEGDYPCADSAFDPMDYTRGNPYYLYAFPDSTFYFAPHNFNAFDPGRTTSIAKVYPDAPKPPPGVHPDSLDETYYTDDGYLKYYEYEFFIDNLLATVSYWVNVTCFDFGSPESGLYPLETKKTVGAKFAYPLTTDNDLYGDESPIYVYPNPYRIDASYRSSGFEGRTLGHLPNDKVRTVNFMNLPPKCTIRIYSLDGDLVRQIDHDKEPSAPDVGHNEWNLVTQNRQLVVSGIYYWSVEAEDGSTQMGKLVILM